MTVGRAGLAVAAAAVALAAALAYRATTRTSTVPGPPPATAVIAAPTASTSPLPQPAAGDAEAEAVTARFAVGLFTVDWSRADPVGQRRANCRPYSTARVDAALAHGQHLQAPGDPRVAAGQHDTVERVDVTVEDATADTIGYSVVVDWTARTRTGDQPHTAYLRVRTIRTPAGWLVDQAQVG